mgnify:CR=1 FL=1
MKYARSGETVPAGRKTVPGNGANVHATDAFYAASATAGDTAGAYLTAQTGNERKRRRNFYGLSKLAIVELEESDYRRRFFYIALKKVLRFTRKQFSYAVTRCRAVKNDKY